VDNFIDPIAQSAILKLRTNEISMNYSTTIAGAIIMLLSLLAKATGIELPYTEKEIESAIVTIVGIIGFTITVYGRWRKGDINILGFRKPEPEVKVTVRPLPEDEIE
jgi:hypothetical protein